MIIVTLTNKFYVKELLISCLTEAAKFFYLIYYSTIRIQLVDSRVFPKRLEKEQNVIYAFWHSKTFLMLPYCQNRQIGILTLSDWKNIIYDGLCRALGYKTVCFKKRTKAVLQLAEHIQNGFSVGLALDGPSGPAGRIKPGVLYLATLTKKPIVLVDLKVKHSFRMRFRWDQYEIPLPFSSATAILSEPLFVSDTSWAEARSQIKFFLKEI